jgi:hypothetical protein
MDKRIKAGLVGIVAAVCASCSTGMYDSLSRTTDDPFTERPTVRSFDVVNTILVSWSKDDAADEFILERSDDAIIPSYSVIYRGTNTSFVDAALIDQSRYLYRLRKTRGDKTFAPSTTAFGVASLVQRDSLEDNDSKSKATHLKDTHDTNMFFYRSYDGDELSDDDWYSVDIPANRKALIAITDYDADSGSTETHYKVYINETRTEDVKDGDSFEIENNTLRDTRYYFMVYPDNEKYVAVSAAGGKMVSYKIVYLSWVPIL